LFLFEKVYRVVIKDNYMPGYVEYSIEGLYLINSNQIVTF